MDFFSIEEKKGIFYSQKGDFLFLAKPWICKILKTIGGVLCGEILNFP